jgi:hypothetical protein
METMPALQEVHLDVESPSRIGAIVHAPSSNLETGLRRYRPKRTGLLHHRLSPPPDYSALRTIQGSLRNLHQGAEVILNPILKRKPNQQARDPRDQRRSSASPSSTGETRRTGSIDNLMDDQTDEERLVEVDESSAESKAPEAASRTPPRGHTGAVPRRRRPEPASPARRPGGSRPRAQELPLLEQEAAAPAQNSTSSLSRKPPPAADAKPPSPRGLGAASAASATEPSLSGTVGDHPSRHRCQDASGRRGFLGSHRRHHHRAGQPQRGVASALRQGAHGRSGRSLGTTGDEVGRASESLSHLSSIIGIQYHTMMSTAVLSRAISAGSCPSCQLSWEVCQGPPTPFR